MKFSICNEMFEGWEFTDVCAAAKKADYDGVEIAPFTLGKLANEVTTEERAAIRDAAAASEIDVVGLHWVLAQTEGFYINHADKEIRDRTAQYLIDLAKLCGDIDGSVIIFGSPKQRSIYQGLSRQQAWDYAVDTFRKMVPTLEERNIVFCLEPLGPEETDFLNTAAEAAEMIREIDSPYFQLLLDVKAMSAESTPIPDIIRANKDIVKHFHANDANRRGPGFGDTDFVPIAEALNEIDYNGWISVEVFDFKPDPVTIATKSMEYLKQVFSK